MSDLRTYEPPERPADDAAMAFNAMREEVALLRVAMRGFAVRQEELAARDYTPDLAKLIVLQEQTAGAVRSLSEQPAMALTPEGMAAGIEAAAVTVRRADHEALAEATRKLTEASQRVDAMVGRARLKQEQFDAQTWSWLFGVLTILAVILFRHLRGMPGL